jgi:hypothetical protein
MMKFTFQKQWFLAFLCLVLLETGIALFVHDRFIRPFAGDALVIWLMFAFIKSFLDFKKMDIYLAAGVFLFACLIELGQYFGLVSLLQLPGNHFAALMIGQTFDFMDLLAYTVGMALLSMLIVK